MPFAVIVPGRPMIPPDACIQVDPCHWIVTLEKPEDISTICISLTQPLPAADLGVGVSYNFPPDDSVEFLGCLTNLSPSNIMSTSWPWVSGGIRTPAVQIHLTIESAGLLMEKLNAKPPVDVKRELAKKTALNLFRYIESFDQAGTQALLTNPSAVLDQWYRRIDEKYKFDPYFILKTE